VASTHPTKKQEVARRWYDKAVVWMQKNESDQRQLERFRAEAFELLSAADESEDEEADENHQPAEDRNGEQH